jgi:hypothetical protein
MKTLFMYFLNLKPFIINKKSIKKFHDFAHIVIDQHHRPTKYMMDILDYLIF